MSTSNSAVTNSVETTAPEGESFAIETFGLTRRFGDLLAADHVSLHVPYGAIFGLLGPNGAGKSTTMRMIACRTPLTAGELFVEGLDIRMHAREIRSLIGVVPQENNLDPDLNVRRNLIVYASYYRIPKKKAAARIDLRRGRGAFPIRHTRGHRAA